MPQPQPSSPKYSQPLIDVPQTIEVIPREVMEAQGVTTLSEALRNVPGISLQAGEGGGASNTSGDMFNLRGFSASNSLFVDGVRDDGLMSRDVFNLEQIEVFMGPTGSDVGRGNAAGYVNMQTKAPLAGSALRRRATATAAAIMNRTTVDLNQPLPPVRPDSWLGQRRVAAERTLGGRRRRRRRLRVEQTNKSIAPSIALGLNTATRVTAAAQITTAGQRARLRHSWLRLVRDAACTDDGDCARARSIRAISTAASNYDFDKVEQESYTGRVEHDVNSNSRCRNQTRYNQTHRDGGHHDHSESPASFVPETQTVTLARQGNERENQILSNQSSLARDS